MKQKLSNNIFIKSSQLMVGGIGVAIAIVIVACLLYWVVKFFQHPIQWFISLF